MNEILEKAITLREDGKLKESNECLIQLVKQYPENATVNYQCAWSFDLLGFEVEAVPYYEQAISIGLPEDDMKGALVGLGSSYRTLGQYDKSKEVLERGIRLFPNHRPLQIFYAMTLYNVKEHCKAMEILLENLAETSSDDEINNYKRALLYYSDKLDTVW